MIAMVSAPFCAAVENDVVLIKARVVENFGDWLQVEIVSGQQVTKVFVGVGEVQDAACDPGADHAFRVRIAEHRHHHSR